MSTTLAIGDGTFYAFWGKAANGKGSAVDGATIGALVKGPDVEPAMGAVTQLQPVAANDALRWMGENRQPAKRSLHVQYQPLSRRTGRQARRVRAGHRAFL